MVSSTVSRTATKEMSKLSRALAGPFPFMEEAQEDVLRPDEAVVEETRFFLGEHQNPAGAVGEALEHSQSMSRGEVGAERPLSWQADRVHSHRRLNLGQRIIVIVGLAIGLAVFGLWATAQGSPVILLAGPAMRPCNQALPIGAA